jgi:hypothetical protein
VGTGVRLFLIDDNDSLQRISMVRLDGLLRFKPGESLPAYAGKRVRCAMVFLDVHRRKVLGIRYTDYFLIPFDAKGRIDKKAWEKGIRLAMELMPSGLKEQYPKSIIDARHRFIKRRYEHEFKWKPNRKVEEAIVAAIFKST